MEANNFLKILACAGVCLITNTPSISVANGIQDSFLDEDAKKASPKTLTPFCQDILKEGEYSAEKTVPAGTNKGCSRNQGCTVRNTGCGKK